MKILIFILLFVFCTFSSIKINIGNTVIINQGQKISVPLSCTGAFGKIKYQVKGLPKGLVLSNGIIEGTNQANAGYYPVMIDAKDEKNNFVSQIVVFKSVNGLLENSRENIKNNQVISNDAKNKNSITSSMDDKNQSIKIRIKDDQITSLIANLKNQNAQAITIGKQNQKIIYEGQDAVSNNEFSFKNQKSSILTQNKNQFNSLNSNNNAVFTNNQLPNHNSQIESHQELSSIFSNIQISYLPQTAQTNLIPSPPIIQQNNINYQKPTTFSNSIPNITPLLIQKSIAPRSQANRNKVTPQNLKATAIFERQLNSNKVIANLLSIIEQLTSNINSIKADIPFYDTELKNKISLQRQIQMKITKADSERSRLRNSINNLNQNINTLRIQLSQFQNSFKNSSMNIVAKKTQVGSLVSSIQKYENLGKQINSKISEQKKEISQIQGQIKNTKSQTLENKYNLDKKNEQLSNIGSLIQNSVKDIKNIDQEINDLKLRLNAAIKRKSIAEEQQKRLRNIQVNAPIIISQLQKKILRNTKNLDILNQRKTITNNQLQKLNKNLDEINLNSGRFKSQLSQIQTQIKITTGNTQDYNNAIATKNKQIADAISNLQFLKSQTQSYQTALRNAYNQGASISVQVKNAKQNLDAVIKKWQRDSQQLAEANINLEKARAQKQLSDLAMQQLLRERSSVLPYSVMLGQNGLINTGTQLGNNPQGFIIQTLKAQNSMNNQNSNTMNSVPSKIPFNLYKKYLPESKANQNNFLKINNQIVQGLSLDSKGVLSFNGDFNCGNAPSNLIDGFIIGVGNNVLNIETQNGRQFIVKVGSCSQATSNLANYKVSVGDKIKLSAQSSRIGVVELYQAAFESSISNTS